MKKLLLILLCLPIIGFGQDSDTSSLVLYIPNSFTPNNDANNDTFGPIGMTEIPNSFEMFIYNQRGMLIFTSDNINDHWDGSYSCTTKTNEVDFLPNNINKMSVYIYIINVVDAFNKTFTYTGQITLIA